MLTPSDSRYRSSSIECDGGSVPISQTYVIEFGYSFTVNARYYVNEKNYNLYYFRQDFIANEA